MGVATADKAELAPWRRRLVREEAAGKVASLADTTGFHCDEKGAGAEGRTRTADTYIFSVVLYRLSYLGAHRILAALDNSGQESPGRGP